MSAIIPRRLFKSVLSRRHFSTGKYEFITTEVRGAKGNVALITLNRPKALNALCDGLMRELGHALQQVDASSTLGCSIITGAGNKAFAAGADIKEMESLSYPANYVGNMLGHWTKIADVSKPLIAAVNGFALGGGNEVAMMCDIVYASTKARFGQPEILLGVIPGSGGTQRLTHAVGKSKAMEMVLTGDMITAQEALELGLVSKVLPPDELLPRALSLAEKIAGMSKVATMAAKEAVNQSYEGTLAQGILFERRTFQALFATKDQKEGMSAFTEKRSPKFTDS